MNKEQFEHLFTDEHRRVLLLPRLRRRHPRADPRAGALRRASTCAATRRKARRRRPSTWWSSTRPAASTSPWTPSVARAASCPTPTRSPPSARRCSTKHKAYVREHFEDLPEISGWSWTHGRGDRKDDRVTPMVPFLALNGGSSSLKYAYYAGRRRDVRDGGQRDQRDSKAPWIGIGAGGPKDQADALAQVMNGDRQAGRSAEGRRPSPGARRRQAVGADPGDRRGDEADLHAAMPFAPLHLPSELAAIEAVKDRFGGYDDVPRRSSASIPTSIGRFRRSRIAMRFRKLSIEGRRPPLRLPRSVVRARGRRRYPFGPAPARWSSPTWGAGRAWSRCRTACRSTPPWA